MEDQPDLIRRPAQTVIALASAALLAASAAGDESGSEDVWRTIFRGSTEVNVVNVDVVVTDAGGRPVTGLGEEDFEIFDGGRRVPISNFYAVENGRPLPLDSTAGAAAPAAGGSAPAAGAELVEPQPLHLIVYVDNVNLQATHRGRVFAQLEEFLLAERRLGARVMLVSNDRALEVRHDFTSVPHEIFVALDELEKTAAASPRFEVDRRHLLRAIEKVDVEEGSGLFDTKPSGATSLQPQSDGDFDQKRITLRTAAEAQRLLPEIQAYSQQRLQHTRDSLAILRQLVDTAAGLPGRKSVLLVSDGLPLKPGEAIYEAYTRRFAALSDVGARVHGGAEAARDDATRYFQALIDHANASNVTFYALDAAPARRLSYGAAESDHHDGGNFASWNDSMASTDAYNTQHGMRYLAQETGGRFGPAHTAWGAVLEGIVTDFANYYSLGFAAERDPERDQRDLEVKVRGKGLKVRHRTSFRDKPVTTRTAERTRAALLIDAVPNPLGVALAAGGAEPQDDGTWVVPLQVAIPLDKLVLLPGESAHVGRVSMFVAVRDEKGRTSEVHRHLCPIRIPNAEVLTALGQKAACGVRLRMRRGPQRVAVSVLDEVTSVDSTAHLALDVGAGERRAELDSSR